MLSSITESLCEVMVTANEACTTSLTTWERSLLDASCSQAWAWQRQLLVDLQRLRHGSCREALLVSRTPPFLCALWGVLHFHSHQEPGHGGSQSAFPLLSQSLEVQGRFVLGSYLSFLSVKRLTCTVFLSEKLHPKMCTCGETKCVLVGRPGTPNQTPLTLFSRMWAQIPETSPSRTSCLCPICFKDHVPYMHLNTLYFTHIRPKYFPLTSLLLLQCTFTFMCLTFMSDLYHCKREENQALQL